LPGSFYRFQRPENFSSLFSLRKAVLRAKPVPLNALLAERESTTTIPKRKGGEKMEANPRDYGERCRFDAFCKTVLKHEAIDYIREMKRRASREMSLERLPQMAMDKLCSADDYPSDSYVFSYCGCDLPIRSQQVADAFACLPEQEQSILILRLVLDLTDSEIGKALGLSRSAVQRRRTKSLNVLRTKLTARKGG
jgi:RNA polymerase sigma factor (sigma-70 family)